MPSSPKPKVSPKQVTGDPAVQEIDALFQAAGLVHSLRGKSAGVTHRMRLKRVAPEELAHPAPVPVIAPNGVQLLKIAAWDKPGRERTPWLWHGFSTRKGGLSRCYCADDAPGDLNLGLRPRTTVKPCPATGACWRKQLPEMRPRPSLPCGRFTPAFLCWAQHRPLAVQLPGKATA